MSTLLIIGVPIQVLRRIEAAAKAAGGVEVRSVRMEIGREGTPRLVPFAAQATLAVWECFDACTTPEKLIVVALPYAPVPPDLLTELDTIQSLGATVLRPQPGQVDWPHFARKLDDAFMNALTGAIRTTAGLMATTPPPTGPVSPPSAEFRAAVARTPGLVLAPNAIDVVDDVARNRFGFFRAAIAALEELVHLVGQTGPLDDFFAQRGLHFAVSGGITASLRLLLPDDQTHDQSTNDHLKKGDATTRVAAARLYFDTVSVGGGFHVVVLYAGPHPESNVLRTLHWPPSR